MHVLDGVDLAIAEGATILVLNDYMPSSKLGRSALVFDAGSKLFAEHFYCSCR